MRGPVQLVKDSVAMVRENAMLFFGIVALPFALTTITTFFMPPENTGVVEAGDWGVYMALSVVGFVLNILMGIAIVKALDNRALTIKGAYSAALPFFLPYIGLTIVSGLVLMVGFILFIVPGIILSVWFAFAFLVLVLENTGIIDSMKRSREYVRGRWWAVFGRLMFMTLVAILWSILVGIVSTMLPGVILSGIMEIVLMVLIAPVVFAYIYLMYQDVKGGVTVAIPAV